MESTNEKKPINVLAEYLTDWIHQNTDEAAPFDSFEGVRNRRIEQKDVERWIFNCNYLYYRFGNYIFDNTSFYSTSAHSNKVIELLDLLDENFKSIKDSNPLNLRSKQDQAVIIEFLKDWPPLVKSSRNTLKKLERALQAFRKVYAGNDEALRIADDFFAEMSAEAQFYAGFAHSNAQAASIRCCKELIPLWCIKEINPLYTLLIWEDDKAITELSDLINESFARDGYPAVEGNYQHDSYAQSVKFVQTDYLDALMDSDDDMGLKALSIPEIYQILDEENFSLTGACSSFEIPSWLLGKAQLIWNIVGCAIFGPKEVVMTTESEQTYTRTRHPLYHEGINEERDGMHGEVILRRLYQNRGPEMVGRLVIDDIHQDFLWRVIGGYYDENAALPPSLFRTQYENLRGIFIATQGYDDLGFVTEGDGDSRYHAELSVRVDENGKRWLILVDLGSKNGTYIVRNRDDSLRYYVLRNGGHIDVGDWATSHDVDASSVEVVDEFVLKRGDFVHLCGSLFEVL